MSESPSENENDIVFLICSERSGSNLISTILGSHSRVYSPPPYHFGRDIILNLHTVIGANPMDSPAWAILEEQMIKPVRRLHSEKQGEVLRDWLDNCRAVDAQRLMRFFYLEQYALDTNHKLVFIKENNLHKLLFFILHCFPQAKFVFQVRDPRDYLASAHARRERIWGNKFGSNYNAMNVWYEDQIGGLRAMSLLGSEQVFYQRYEDLVSNPRLVLAKLCAFLGIDFEDEMLNFHQTSDAKKLAGSHGARQNVAQPLMADNFGKYRTKLSRREIRMVEAYLGPLMDKFGYSRDFPSAGKASRFDIIRPQMTEFFERYMNGERQPFYKDGGGGFTTKLLRLGGKLDTAYVAARAESDS